jgi:hypothetical protein
MLERARALVWVAVAMTGCVYTAPVLTTPVVVTPESASRLVVRVQSDVDQDKKLTAEALSKLASVTNAIAAELRQASFQVTMSSSTPSASTVKVGYASGYLGEYQVVVEANGVVLEQIVGHSVNSSADEAAFARHTRQRLERSEGLASLAAELEAKPQALKGDAPRSWVKTTGASAATRRLAVLEFRGSIAPNLLALLSDQARSAAVEAVRPHGIAVMTRENTSVMLRDQGRAPGACTEGDCEVETARLIGAHLVVTGEVWRVGSAQFLQMKLFDAEAGTLLASKQADATDDLALVKAAKPAAAALFE